MIPSCFSFFFTFRCLASFLVQQLYVLLQQSRSSRCAILNRLGFCFCSGGAGGKGVWGKLTDLYDDSGVGDVKDPNYDSNEEVRRIVLRFIPLEFRGIVLISPLEFSVCSSTALSDKLFCDLCAYLLFSFTGGLRCSDHRSSIGRRRPWPDCYANTEGQFSLWSVYVCLCLCVHACVRVRARLCVWEREGERGEGEGERGEGEGERV